MIWISQFDSDFKMRNALPARLARHVAATEYNGLIWAFSIIDNDPSPLRPLEQFGFTIEAVPGRRDAPSVPAAPREMPSAYPAPPGPQRPTSEQRPRSNPDYSAIWRFQSKTGNIACELAGTNGEGTAVCEVRQNAYKRQVKPDCRPDWVSSFGLRQGRAVAVNCYADSALQGALPVQDYGHPLTAGSITCAIDENTGVTCRDANTGRYFQATRQRARWG